MHARHLQNKARERNVLSRLGLYSGLIRATVTAVRSMGEEGDINALPPRLDMPPALTADGEPVFVLGVDALDSDAVLL